MVGGIVIAVAAALVWGGYLYYLKRAFEGYAASLLTVGINSFALVWYLPVWYFRVGSATTTEALTTFGVSELGIIVATTTMIAGAMIAFLRALAIGEVSYVAPISKIVPVFVLPIEVVVLGQVLTPLQVAGVLVATAAVYVANFRGGSLLEPLRQATTSTAARLAILSAMAFGVSDVARRIARSWRSRSASGSRSYSAASRSCCFRPRFERPRRRRCGRICRSLRSADCSSRPVKG